MERAGGDEEGKMGTNNTYTPPPPLTDQGDKAVVVGGLREFDALLSIFSRSAALFVATQIHDLV